MINLKNVKFKQFVLQILTISHGLHQQIELAQLLKTFQVQELTFNLNI